MEKRVDEMFMKRAFFASFFDFVTAASFMDVMIAFTMLKVFVDGMIFLSPEKVDHVSEESAEHDLKAKKGKGHWPLPFEIAKHDRKGFVRASDEDGDKRAQSDVVFGVKVAGNDGDSALRDGSNKRTK